MTTHNSRQGSSMKPLSYTRRNLLRGALAGTALFPLLDASRAFGQTQYPTRFLVFFTPNGTRNRLFWPTGTETNFQLNTLTAPLQNFKNRLTFLKGIKLNNSLQNGALGGTLGSEHARGTGGMLTARPLNPGTQFKSFGNTTSGWGSGQSIDQYLADRFGNQTTFKSLQLGVHVRDTEVRSRISYRASNQPNPPRENPADVFNTLFGEAATSRLAAQRQSVFDLTRGEINRVMGLVGQDDRLKLEAHLTSMRDVEERLVQLQNAGSCQAPAMQTVDLRDDGQYAQAGRLQMDLAAAALACNMTRFITLQWSYAESEHLFQFLSINGNHHNISHDFSQSGPGYDAYNKIQTWYTDQLRYMLEKLDSYKEGTGSVLDNTLVLWATEIGESTTHALTTMPYVFAGGAGGRIRPGRFIDYGTGSRERDNNQMLVSIAHAMGAEDLNQFGDPSGATGPLPSLV